MMLKTKIKLWALAILTIIVGIAYGVLQLEFVQKKVFDVKADLVGGERTVTFYSKMNGEKIASYYDKDTRYEVGSDKTISVWLGSQNKKVHSSLEFIIEDVKSDKK